MTGAAFGFLLFALTILIYSVIAVTAVWVLRRGQIKTSESVAEIIVVAKQIALAQDSVLTVEQQLVALLSVAPDAAMTFNGKTGKVTYANTPAYELFGYGSELTDLSVEDLMPERFRARHYVHRAGFMSAPRSRPMGPFLKIYILTKSKEEVRVHIGLNNYGTNSVVAWIKPIASEAIEEVDDGQIHAHS